LSGGTKRIAGDNDPPAAGCPTCPDRAPARRGGLGPALSQGCLELLLKEEVSTRMPRPDEIAALHLRPGVPVLDVWHTSIDQDGQPYELTRFVMRGDMTGLLYDVPVE